MSAAGGATPARRIPRLPTPRWAVSLADIGLLLLGSFAMLNAMASERAEKNGAAVSDVPQGDAKPARVGHFAAGDLFEPGEARLTASGEAELRAVASHAAGQRLTLVSRGVGEATDRLDAFELAAARSAVVARALSRGGVAPVVRLTSTGSGTGEQMLEIEAQ